MEICNEYYSIIKAAVTKIGKRCCGSIIATEIETSNSQGLCSCIFELSISFRDDYEINEYKSLLIETSRDFYSSWRLLLILLTTLLYLLCYLDR